MDIWLGFLPGSGATSIEMLLRSDCTSLETLPVDDFWVEGKDFVTGHGSGKQWHPYTSQELFNPKYKKAKVNIFTPIIPMSDLKGKEILEHIYIQPGIKFYLGPSCKRSCEFAVITTQKVPSYPNNIINLEHSAQWSTGSLDKWEIREAISLNFMQWFVPQMIEQWQIASNLGFTCIDTLELFSCYPTVVDSIVNQIGCTITDNEMYKQHVNHWFTGQDKIWNDWDRYNEYKNGKGKLTGDIVHEAMIQYNLRERGIELKCYGLNEFPDAQTLKDFYE